MTFPVLYVAATALYYITLEAVAGLLYAPILLAMGHMSNAVYANDPDLAIKYAGWAFGAAWIAQFIGHGKVRLHTAGHGIPPPCACAASSTFSLLSWPLSSRDELQRFSTRCSSLSFSL